MAKRRIYELARAMGLGSTDVLAYAQRLGFGVTSVLSGLDEDDAALLRRSMLEERDAPAPQAVEIVDEAGVDPDCVEANDDGDAAPIGFGDGAQSDTSHLARPPADGPQRGDSLLSRATTWLGWLFRGDRDGATNGSFDADPTYVSRTVHRIRAMTEASVDMTGQDPDEVRARLARMVYGGSKHRHDTSTSA